MALYLVSGPAWGAESDALKNSLQQLMSPNIPERTDAAKFLIINWKVSLQLLIDKLPSFESTAASPKQTSSGDIAGMVGITDALRSILANKEREGAIETFRRYDNDPKVISTLTWMARSDNRDLRVNSTYVLANIVDNTNVCIVIDHLRDPTISDNGRINLLQAIVPVAGYAYQENADLIKEALPIILKNAGRNVTQTKAVIAQIEHRVKSSANAGQHLESANIRMQCPYSGIAPHH